MPFLPVRAAHRGKGAGEQQVQGSLTKLMISLPEITF
jgi:hypothetical protein